MTSILVCNNHAKSGQAKNFNFTPIILKLSKLHPNKKWILTSKDKEPNFERKSYPNVIYSSEIVKKVKGEACPADAIVFGRVDDPESRVSGAGHSARGYHHLEELGILPRVTYLKGETDGHRG